MGTVFGTGPFLPSTNLLPENATDGSLLQQVDVEQAISEVLVPRYSSGNLYLFDTYAGTYVVPHSVPALLSGSTASLGKAPFGHHLAASSPNGAYGFTPYTNAQTPHGLPTEKATALGNLAQNSGPDDGVSHTSTLPPTTVLTTLAAAGRNPADITIPTQAGTDGSGGEEEAATGRGTVEATDEPDDDVGTHITNDEISRLLANGYSPANIDIAEEAMAQGAPREIVEFLLGHGDQPQRAPVPQPVDEYAGAAQAAEFLEATAKGMGIAVKQAVLGELTDEQNDLGTSLEIAVGLSPLDTAADARDVGALMRKIKENPDDQVSRDKLAIYGLAVFIPCMSGRLLSKILRDGTAEGLEEGAKALAKNSDEVAQGLGKNADEAADVASGVAPKAIAKSAGDLFEASVKNTFRNKIIRENEVLRDAGGRVIGEIDFETAEAIAEVGISLRGKVDQLHKLAEIAAQRGKRLDVIYGPDTAPGTLKFLKESLGNKFGNRVRFIPHE